MIISNGLWVLEGLGTITPRTNEVYALDVAGMTTSVGLSAPTSPAVVLHLKVDAGDDTAVTYAQTPTIGSGTTILLPIVGAGLAAGLYEFHVTFATSGNTREVIAPFEVVE